MTIKDNKVTYELTIGCKRVSYNKWIFYYNPMIHTFNQIWIHTSNDLTEVSWLEYPICYLPTVCTSNNIHHQLVIFGDFNRHLSEISYIFVNVDDIFHIRLYIGYSQYSLHVSLNLFWVIGGGGVVFLGMGYMACHSPYMGLASSVNMYNGYICV